MLSEFSNLYAQWRRNRTIGWKLHESGSSRPPEKLLQIIWAGQRLKREALHTTGDDELKVLHPGFWNREAGPDFKGAIVRIEGKEAIEGDVEIDVVPGGWTAHGHDRNPDFRNVILQVVWESTPKRKSKHPTLELQPFIDAPLAELAELLDDTTPPPLKPDHRGQCCAPLRQIPQLQLESLLESAARVRLDARAAQMRARARQVGWEQVLLEAMFRGLGYKNNAWPMQRLAELAPSIISESEAPDPLRMQALLLGISGLLPDQIKNNPDGASDFFRQIWDIWWRERSRFHADVLPSRIWKLRGLRPANQPQRRLALGAYWICDPEFFPQIEKWFTSLPVQGDSLHMDELVRILCPAKDSFWGTHYTLRSGKLVQHLPLIGSTRTTDLVVNCILPWFYTRASVGGNPDYRIRAERAWMRWPKSDDNAVLRHARARLLGNAGPSVLKTAAHQQGLMQIVRDYCDHSNAICDDCQFPELLSDWQTKHRRLVPVEQRVP